MTLKSISTKFLLFVSYSLIPLGGVALWAGIFWRYWAGGFLGLHIIFYILAAALPLIGWQNVKRIKKQNPSTDSNNKKAVKINLLLYIIPSPCLRQHHLTPREQFP